MLKNLPDDINVRHVNDDVILTINFKNHDWEINMTGAEAQALGQSLITCGGNAVLPPVPANGVACPLPAVG